MPHRPPVGGIYIPPVGVSEDILKLIKVVVVEISADGSPVEKKYHRDHQARKG
jgi:hypothetical protein